EAIQAGEFDNLPGAGRPLDLRENPYVPDEWRLAFKVLENAGMVPPWIALAQEIDADIAFLHRRADEHFALVRDRLQAALTPSTLARFRSEVRNLKALHARAPVRHQERIAEINRKIRSFNATVPVDSAARPIFDPEGEMRVWADRLPAYLNY